MVEKLNTTMLTLSEAAEVLGVEPGTVREWVRRGVVACYGFDSTGNVYFRREDVERFAGRQQSDGHPVRAGEPTGKVGNRGGCEPIPGAGRARRLRPGNL